MPKPTHSDQRNVAVAATGASGAIFLKQLLLTCERDDRIANLNFIPSDNALRVLAEELGLTGRSNLVEQLLGTSHPRSPYRAMPISAPMSPAVLT